MLNLESAVPLYRQLADRLGGSIERGEYRVGERIPSEHALCARYGIGRPTVRQATEMLVRRGLLERRRGSGTFVRRSPAHLDVFSMAGTLASFRARGIEPRIAVLSAVQGMPVDAETEHPFAGRRAHFVRRLSATEQGPALLEDLYLDPELFGELQGFDGRSLSQWVREHYGTEPSSMQQEFGVTCLDGEQGSALELQEGAHVLHVRRHLHFPKGRDGIYAELYCRSDRVVLSQEIGGP